MQIENPRPGFRHAATRVIAARMIATRMLAVAMVAAVTLPAAGCHDGPMYGLKAANPFYSMKQWKADEALGPSDHVRRVELHKLVGVMPNLPPERQAYWHDHIRGILDHDPSPEMRRLAIMAAGVSSHPPSRELISTGLRDDSLKVRLATCEVLGRQTDEDAARLLAETAGSTTDLDVRNAALAALANHRSDYAVDALRLALDDRNPATRALAVESLRGATGKDYGDDPTVWIAALDGQAVSEQPVQIADRVKRLFH